MPSPSSGFAIIYYGCVNDLSRPDPEVHPQPESYWGNVNPIGPRACYDEAKRVAETMMYAYQKQVSDHTSLLCYRSFLTLSVD